MRVRLTYFLLIALGCFVSCKKEETPKSNDSFIKTILTDSDMVSVACFEISDNNLIALSRNLDFITPGWMVKFTDKGEELWRKKVARENRVLWNAIPLKTGGYLTFGYDEDYNSELKFCMYDNDGNLLTVTSITLNGFAAGYQGGDIIPLNNGNYALTFSSNASGKGYLLILDNSLNMLITKTFVSSDPNYFECFIHGIQQMNDSSLGITASTIYSGLGAAHCNSMMIVTDLNGTERSRTFLQDSTKSETANCLGINSRGLLSVTSRMSGFNSGNGIFADVFSNSSGQLICGRINLIHYDTEGNFIERREVLTHPTNGIILSVKICRDGGLILCGTVNLNNSQTVASNSALYLLKLDADYNEVWSRVIPTQYQSYGMDVAELSNGGYCLVGHQRTNNQIFNMLLIKTDPNGNY